jgi:hypothetical protein
MARGAVEEGHTPIALPPLLTRIGPVFPRHARWLRYGVAMGVVLGVFLLRLALSPLLGYRLHSCRFCSRCCSAPI